MSTLELHARPAFRFAWLYSRNADLFMFIMPFFVTIALCFMTESHAFLFFTPALILMFIEPIIGSLHGSATWFHYMDKRNLEWYTGCTKRLMLFFVAPMLILAATVVGDMYDQMSTFFVYVVWTIQHLTQQNIGILLLYRKQGDAQVSRVLEARLLQLSAAAFGVAYFYRIAFMPKGQDLQMIVTAVVALNCVIALVYLKSLSTQVKAGNSLNVSALIFWFIAIFMWIPLLAGPINFYLAMFLPLMVHWCQYIGLNLHLVNSKYAVAENRNYLFGGKVAPMCAFALFATGYVGFVYFCAHSMQTPLDPHVVKSLQAVVMGLGNAHYFQDAFIWRFREPFLRETLLPYVKGTA